jgi:hypothetical protein
MDNIKNTLDNVYVSGLVKIFIILYAALAAPTLPKWIAKLFHQPAFQIVFFALIAYTATKDLSISLLLALAFFVSFHSYTRFVLSRVVDNSKKLLHINRKHSNTSSDYVNYRQMDGDVKYRQIDGDVVNAALARDDAFLKADMESSKVIDAYKLSHAKKPASGELPGLTHSELSEF